MTSDVISLSTEQQQSIVYSAMEMAEAFKHIPAVAKNLINSAKDAMGHMQQMLYSSPAFIQIIKSSVGEEVFKAVLSPEQKDMLAQGALRLMTRKDGALLAKLVDPKTGQVVSNVPLQGVNVSPAFSQAMANFAIQMQLAQIAEQIQTVQLAIEEVRQGQENDRLAVAYSCQQKLIQALLIQNPDLRINALMRIVFDAEDSRNLLMLSQKNNVDYIRKLPESNMMKFFGSTKADKIDNRMSEIRTGLAALNMVSLVETMAYQELGEHEAAKSSLDYYGQFIQDTYLDHKGLVERLDSLDKSKEPYWTKTIPVISKKIQSLPIYNQLLLGDEANGTKALQE